jgi:hypothetical protein
MNQRRSRTILFLAANPLDTDSLRLDQESREIGEGLRRARYRDRFELKQAWAVRPQDFQRAMLEYEPHIVHFSGHGAGEQGIVLENEDGSSRPVSAEALGGLFGLHPQVECVLLNACYSELQVQAIVQHVQYVIGMNQAIGDEAAIVFTTAFYDALGAGRPIDFAFKSGRAAIQFAGFPEHLTPVLTRRDPPAKRSDAWDKAKGTIDDPTPGQVVRPTFECSGTVSGMDSALSLWLVVEAGGLVWPKEGKILVDRDGRWSATVFEDGAVSEFAVALYLVDSPVDRAISEWLRHGQETGTYAELKSIPAERRRLFRIDGLRLDRAQETGGTGISDEPAQRSAGTRNEDILQRQLKWYEETSKMLAAIGLTIEIAWTLEDTKEDEGARSKTWHEVQQHYLGLTGVLNDAKLLGSQRAIRAVSRLIERFNDVSDQTEGFDERQLAANHSKVWELTDPLERANQVLRAEWRRLSGIDP